MRCASFDGTRPRPGRSRAICSSAATRTSSPADPCPAATSRSSSSTAWSPRSSAAKIRHLADNGYVTLSADEYFQVLLGTRPPPEKAVVLTFDDGRGSVRTVGLPLMRRHGMKGIVFLVPGRMRLAARAPAPDLGRRARRDRRAPRPSSAREEGEGSFLSWEEIDELSRIGPLRLPEPHPLPRAHPHGAAARGVHDARPQEGVRAFDVPLIRDGGTRPPEPRTSPSARPSSAPSRASPRRCASTRTPRFARPASRGWRRREARASSAARAGRGELRRLVNAPEGLRAASRRPRTARPRSAASSRNPRRSSRSGREGRSSTSATPGTSPVPPRAGWRARSATAPPSAARCTARP